MENLKMSLSVSNEYNVRFGFVRPVLKRTGWWWNRKMQPVTVANFPELSRQWDAPKLQNDTIFKDRTKLVSQVLMSVVARKLKIKNGDEIRICNDGSLVVLTTPQTLAAVRGYENAVGYATHPLRNRFLTSPEYQGPPIIFA